MKFTLKLKMHEIVMPHRTFSKRKICTLVLIRENWLNIQSMVNGPVFGGTFYVQCFPTSRQLRVRWQTSMIGGRGFSLVGQHSSRAESEKTLNVIKDDQTSEREPLPFMVANLDFNKDKHF